MKGWTFPLPDDDAWSCDGTEESKRGNTFETNTSFDEEPMEPSAPTPTRCPIHAGNSEPDTMVTCEGDISPSTTVSQSFEGKPSTKWDCRVISGSEEEMFHSGGPSVGANTQDRQFEHSLTNSANKIFGLQHVAGEQQHNQWSYPQHMTSLFTEHPQSTLEATNARRLTLTGGAPDHPSSTAASDWTPTRMSSQYYASTTDLLLQNLSMVVGNPSVRCFANAPWRAFCWMCAYLAEFNRDPWVSSKMLSRPAWNSQNRWTSKDLRGCTTYGKNMTSTWREMRHILSIHSGFTPKPG